MKKVKEHVKSKGKLVMVPMVILVVLISIFIFNGLQKADTAIATTEEGTYLEASGMVENNSIDLSSEVTGTVSDLMIKEGDTIKEGQVIAQISNSGIINQYEQALDNLKIAEKNLQIAQESISAYKGVYADSTQQAKSAYNSSYGEYEKVLEGASAEEIQQVQETYNQAEINFKYLEENLEESKALLEYDIITQKDYDEIEKNYNLAQAQLNTASAKLDQIQAGPSDATLKAVQNKMLQAKASHEFSISNGNMQLKGLEGQYEMAALKFDQTQTIVDQLKEELSKMEIRSPIDGVVNLLTINKGEFTTLGKPLAEILDPKNMEIKVYVSESNIGHIKTGQEVNIHVDSTDEAFKGKVIRINSNAEFTPKNIQTKEERVNTVFEVKIQIQDSKGVIKPGMPVDVSIKID
ncbi:HlyD family efflux transporter periplasmic adaptor subunit [Tissierella creatinini]|nr:HlyD family efflux transporter periplasmic adaptor subunit [Tissierella creatinini]TJX63875.1 HlyD family efflux transporter periplasmic adaptor subunit [Soehngenia saccharolytica]